MRFAGYRTPVQSAPSVARRRPLGILALVAIAATAGCKGDSKASPEAADHVTPALLAQRAAEAGVDEAGTLYLTSVAPGDFPGALPVYPGSRVTLAGRRSLADGKLAWSLTVETADSKAQVRAFYDEHLPGFSPASDIDILDSALWVWRSPAYDLNVVVGRGADGKTTVTLDVAER
jgi:hypothetical protein